MTTQRIIVWFSCGSTSACAARLAINKYGADRVMVVYCNTSKSEDADNVRFMREVEQWLGVKVTVISSKKFSTVDEVFESRRYIAGINGAPCTVEMKKIPRFDFQRADDVHIFGYDASEGGRISDFEQNNPDMFLEWILRDNGITKKACHAMIESAGILQPLRYRQGFKNNNCECCGKASSIAYWVLSRRLNPVSFARRADQSRRFGARLTRWKGK